MPEYFNGLFFANVYSLPIALLKNGRTYFISLFYDLKKFIFAHTIDFSFSFYNYCTKPGWQSCIFKMAANKYLALVSGKIKEIFASVTGTANAIPAGDATGRLDISWLPIGVGSEVQIEFGMELVPKEQLDDNLFSCDLSC